MTYRAIGKPLGSVAFGRILFDDVQASCPGVFTAATKDFCPFFRLSWDSDEIYVMRFVVSGMNSGVKTAAQGVKWANAYGNTLMTQCLPFACPSVERTDVKALVFDGRPGTGSYNIDIVVTTPDDGLPLLGQRLESTTVDMLNGDADLRSVWPDFRVEEFHPLLMLGKTAQAKAQIADWRAVPSLWSWELWEQNQGAPEKSKGKTDAYGKGEGVWVGGSAAKPQARLKPRVEPPIVPPSNGPPPPVPPKPYKAETGLGTAVGLALLGGISWFAFGTRIRDHLSGQKKKEKQHVLHSPW
ncbi:MAG: hypothetical protein V3S01_08305 [Dehalococcoidia bacterium]